MVIDNCYFEREVVVYNGFRYEVFVVLIIEKGVERIKEIMFNEGYEVIGIDEV